MQRDSYVLMWENTLFHYSQSSKDWLSSPPIGERSAAGLSDTGNPGSEDERSWGSERPDSPPALAGLKTTEPASFECTARLFLPEQHLSSEEGRETRKP